MTLNKTLSRMIVGSALVGASSASAQTARVQIIHNSADAAAAVVDIYVNGAAEPAVPDFAFRTATPFIDLPAGEDLEVGIAPGNSEGPQDIIPGLTFNYNLADGETYVLVANGIVSATGYTPAPAFELSVFATGREVASVSGNTDILVLHGSTDAPNVQVAELTALAGAVVVPEFGYGNFSVDYLEVPAVDLTLQVQLPGGAPVATYSAPLGSLGLADAALVAVASGFLDPSVNSDGPGFGIWVAPPSGGLMIELPLATARVQVIHNSADAAAAVVDVYINGGATPAIPDFTFRTATPFIDLPAGEEFEIGIAPGNSAGPQDIIPGLTFPFTLDNYETYVVVANGIVSGTGYTPAPAFELSAFATGREAASVSGNTDILVLHGSTDAPNVQVAELTALAGAVVVPEFGYGDFSVDYLEVPAVDLTLQVQLPGSNAPVATYSAPLGTLGLADAALVAVASGFLDPSVNSDGAGFGIWVALPSGGDMIELPLATARVQVIHNSADAAAAVVDVYINGGATPAIPDFTFRTATPFIDLPAGEEFEIGIAPGNSAGPQDIIPGLTFPFTLDNYETYVVVANGIVSATGYTPAPAFGFNVFAPGREEASVSGNTDILVIHGSTDAPEVQVAELAVLDGAVVVPAFTYGSFNDDYLEVPAVDLALQVQLPSGAPVATYSAPLGTLGLADSALVAVASGFLDPTVNSNGPAFGLWVALPSGGELIPLPLITNVGMNDLDETLNLNVWPNPTNSVLNVSIDATEGRRVNATISDMSGRVVMQVPSTQVVAGENRLMVDMSALAEGMYTVTVIGEKGIRTTAVQVAR